MRDGKRHTAQPVLEPMEPRVVPSVMGIQAHRVQAIVAHIGRMNNPVKQANAFQRENNQALRNLQHQEYLVHVRSLERTPSAAPTPEQKAAGAISNFFKSAGASL